VPRERVQCAKLSVPVLAPVVGLGCAIREIFVGAAPLPVTHDAIGNRAAKNNDADQPKRDRLCDPVSTGSPLAAAPVGKAAAIKTARKPDLCT